MPAYNEAAMLTQSLHEIVDGLRARGVEHEVLVVENGSTDDTRAVAEQLAHDLSEVRVLTLGASDYGEALRSGILAARAPAIVTFDADYYDLAFLDRACARLAAAPAPAIVVGSKRAPGTVDDRSWMRRAITAAFVGALRVGFALSVSDTHGMKALDRDAVTPLARRCRNGRDLFDTELVLRAGRAGLLVAELPVTVVERRPSRTPITRRALRTAWGLVRLRVQLWRERSAP